LIIHDIKFLGGKVHKRSLPAFPPPAPAELAEKRLLLAQGELAQFYNGEEGIRYIAAIEFVKGTVRGNHYHQRKQEWVYLISGSVELVVEDVESKLRETVNMVAGDLAYVSPGVAHTFVVQESGMAVEFSPVRFDPADTTRYPLA
jgi:quercetin dioxygenase-like cupin family protein